MSSYEMIRAGIGYDPVILSCETTNNSTKYFELSSIKDAHPPDDWEKGKFNEISDEEASLAFCGQADGWGFEKLPEQSFASLEEVMAFIKDSRSA